ncbi:unnamed protein product [Urochloa humidicola]
MARETGDTAFHEEKGLEGEAPKPMRAAAACSAAPGFFFSRLDDWTGRGKRGGSGVLVLRLRACTVAACSGWSRESPVRGRGRRRASALGCLSPVAVAQLSTGVGQCRGLLGFWLPRFSNCSKPPLSETRRGDMSTGIWIVEYRDSALLNMMPLEDKLTLTVCVLE